MIWLKGLISAIIGGVATTITLTIVDPANYNFADLGKLGTLTIVSAIVSAAMYLKQSPLPE